MILVVRRWLSGVERTIIGDQSYTLLSGKTGCVYAAKGVS
jgi:hypothetical protein